MDVKTIFLHDNLDKLIYIEQQEGLYDTRNGRLILIKEIFEWFKVIWKWNKHFDSCLLLIGNRWCNCAYCVYVMSLDYGSFILLLLYYVGKLFDKKKFGASKKILDIEIYKDMGARKLWLSHKIYVEKVLDKFT